ncbi:helix-turn-helix transcriptional regulator [Bacillus sp. 3255]|uniref:helix-turn-helix domain-containing protein n=1 Tax=Bacillus sp. 3255 TaxID=2817904 RepID=UPI00285F1A43|nr:helix-turn-helix transcriptional regulator [Bacillus sp. 3255]MDR6884868.1 transcriptional regulator with XRE-family HTH domain [Bacillus sp. 3255]
MLTLGEKIRSLREKRSLKQEDLAEMIDKKRTDISSYEIGRTMPNAETLIKIADVFRVSVDYLLGRTEDPHQIFENKEELPNESKQVIFRVTEMLQEGMSEEDLNSAVEFLEFLRDRNAKRNKK